MSFTEHWERGAETDADVFEVLRARRSSLLEEMTGTSASLTAR